MIRRIQATSCAAALALLAPAAAGAQTAAGPSVTLFSSGRVLVRRSLAMPIPVGTSTQTFAIGPFDPSTLAPLDPGITIERVTADQGVSEDALLRRNIGARFSIDQGDKAPRTATLLSMDPERWEWADGGVVFGRPGRIIWSKDRVPTTQTADVTLHSDRARSTIPVMYETGGSAWQASYRLFVGSGGHVDGSAVISTGSLDLAGAEVQLLAGDIGTRNSPQPYAAKAYEVAGARLQAAPAPPAEQSVGEIHLYTLPDHVTFTPGVVTVVPLFAPTSAVAERRYIVPGGVPWYGPLNRQADEETVPVQVTWHLARKPGTAFGDLPLPAGSVNIYDRDAAGRVELIGQADIDHTAPGAELVLNAGTAFDLTAKRVQTDFNIVRSTTAGQNTSTASYRVTVSNARDSAVTVEVREDHNGDWSVIDSSVPADKRSSTRTVFRLAIPAKGTAVLTYRVRVQW
jgi:hypothetical protein